MFFKSKDEKCSLRGISTLQDREVVSQSVLHDYVMTKLTHQEISGMKRSVAYHQNVSRTQVNLSKQALKCRNIWYAIYLSVIHHYVPRRIVFGILQNLPGCWCIMSVSLDYSETDRLSFT